MERYALLIAGPSGSLSGAIDRHTKFEGDDLRKSDPKFEPPRHWQYLAAVNELRVFAGQRYGKPLIALALRWVLDQPGISVALWGARRVEELEPLDDVLGWRLDDDAMAAIDAIITHEVRDPVGPEFMAPPERTPDHPRAA